MLDRRRKQLTSIIFFHLPPPLKNNYSLYHPYAQIIETRKLEYQMSFIIGLFHSYLKVPLGMRHFQFCQF